MRFFEGSKIAGGKNMDGVSILPVPSASMSMWFYKMQIATIYLPGGRQRKKVGGTAIFPVAKQNWSTNLQQNC